MTALAERRRFLIAYRKTGTLDGAIAASGTPAETHQAWMRDQDYASAFRAVTKEIAAPPRQTKAKEPAKKRGRPPKQIVPPATKEGDAECPTTLKNGGAHIVGEQTEAIAEPVQSPSPKCVHPSEPAPETAPEPIPKAGYTKIFVEQSQEVAGPEAPPRLEPEFVPNVEITLASDGDQRRLIDEFGELDRRMQVRALDYQRYETLKKAIKSWFDSAPADADGTCEGDVYLLHLSARERERRIRDMRELVEAIGIDRFVEICTVPIGALENILGKARVVSLCVDARTGSRRIKAIAKRAVSVVT